MAQFLYKIINTDGGWENGKIEASSLEEVASQIKRQGWFIAELKEFRKPKYSLLPFWQKEKLPSLELIALTDHLASMIKSGTPLVEALEAYSDEKKGSTMIDSIIKDIERGRHLSDALANFPQNFSPLYISLIQAGELTGSLDETLEYLAGELRREHEFKERIKSAMLYPTIVLFAALFVVSLLVLVIIPKIAAITKSFGGDLPLVTRIVSTVAEFLANFGPLILVLIFLSIVGFVSLLKNRQTKKTLDPYILKIPLVGKTLKKYILARFLRIVGSCVKYGIPLTSAFSTVGKVVDNIRYRQASERIDEKILRGVSLSLALSDEGADLFPSMIVRTVKGAEKTGAVDSALLRLSTTYEIEVDRDLKRITDLIEPAMVIVLGIIVAAIAIAVIGPIYQITTKIK